MRISKDFVHLKDFAVLYAFPQHLCAQRLSVVLDVEVRVLLLQLYSDWKSEV